MRRRSKSMDQGPGQDSFLDIVANLVGILIILVMVVGVRARDAIVQEQTQSEALPELDSIDVDTPRQAAKAVERDVIKLKQQLAAAQLETRYRQLERDQMLARIGLLEHDLQSRRQQLTEQQQAELDAARDVARLEREFDDLKRMRQTVENSEAPPVVLRHLPTPLAQTVFGKEIHFRLEGGRIVHVPWDELVERLKQDAPEKIWKLKDAPEVTERIGPIEGFRMEYTLVRNEYQVNTRAGAAVQRRGELDQFSLFPVGDQLGEPIQQALQQGSRLIYELRRHPPEQTTVTVWVYPDSYGDFRQIKEQLHAWGYTTASRPMPTGMPIMASRFGAKSAAQ